METVGLTFAIWLSHPAILEQGFPSRRLRALTMVRVRLTFVRGPGARMRRESSRFLSGISSNPNPLALRSPRSNSSKTLRRRAGSTLLMQRRTDASQAVVYRVPVVSLGLFLPFRSRIGTDVDSCSKRG